MLQGAIIGAVAGLIMYLIQSARKKKQAKSDLLDQENTTNDLNANSSENE